MRTPESFKEQKGYLTIAQNNNETDYLELAYCLALSIKCSQKVVKSFAVLVDKETATLVTDKHRAVFDYIIEFDEDDSVADNWKLKNEWKVWWLTPFKETIKIEADMLVLVNIDHWWQGLQQTEVCLTTNIRDYEGNVSCCRAYRKVFDLSLLPDVYNGFMYFRYGHESMKFFSCAKHVYQNWDYFRDSVLTNCVDDIPTTDVVFAVAAKIVGVEKCTNPALSYPSFVHMKGAINGWGVNTDWLAKLYSQLDNNLNLTVGFNRQVYPFHYFQKQFITSTDVLSKLEHEYHTRFANTSTK